MEKKSAGELPQLLSREAEALKDELAASNGSVSPRQIERAGLIAQLAGICERRGMEPPPAHPAQPRWLAAVGFLLSLVIASLLFFGHISETEIQLDAAVSRIAFRLRSREILSGTLPVSSLGVVGVRKVQIPRSRSRDAEDWDTGEPRLTA